MDKYYECALSDLLRYVELILANESPTIKDFKIKIFDYVYRYFRNITFVDLDREIEGTLFKLGKDTYYKYKDWLTC